MATRITVAQLAEQQKAADGNIAALTEAVNSIALLLGAAADEEPTTQESAPQTVLVEAAEMVEHETASLTELAPAQVADETAVESFGLSLDRQSSKSKGGSLRFWSGSDPEGPQASVYVSGADDYEGKSLALTITSVEDGSAVLRQVTTASGSPKVTKKRLAWEGRFAYGGATLQVFVNSPKAGNTLPSEVGIKLAL